MLVRERMKSPGKRINVNAAVSEALAVYEGCDTSWLPVVDSEGKLLGVLTPSDVRKAKAALKERKKEDTEPVLQNFVTSKFLTVNENTPIEEAVRIMIDYDIEELPVVKDGYYSGIITEKMILRVLMEITGARRQGVRLMVEFDNKTGELLRLLNVICENDGNVEGFCTYCAPESEYIIAMMRVDGVDKYSLKQAIKSMGQRVIDIR